jgi:hypothetical protein
MTETKQAWSQVADEFGGLGLKLKLHSSSRPPRPMPTTSP